TPWAEPQPMIDDNLHPPIPVPHTRRIAAKFAKLPELLQRRSNKAVLTVVGAVYGGVNLSWRRLGGAYVMEAFLIVLAVIAAAGVVIFLFVIEPRRKIYDYDPLDLR